MVIALGADVHPDLRPGWLRVVTSSTQSRGAFELHDVLRDVYWWSDRHRGDVDAVQVPSGSE